MTNSRARICLLLLEEPSETYREHVNIEGMPLASLDWTVNMAMRQGRVKQSKQAIIYICTSKVYNSIARMHTGCEME